MRKKVKGKGKGQTPADTKLRLNEALSSLDERCSTIEGKIKNCNKELIGPKNLIQKAKASKSPAKKKIILQQRQKAQRILQKRKMFETQLTQLRNQELTIQTQMFQLENLEFAAQQADTMKHTKKAMEKLRMDPDKVADLKFDTEAYNEEFAEVQGILGEQTAGFEFDDNELELELGMLDDEEELVTVPVPSRKVKNVSKKDQFEAELEAELDLIDLPELNITESPEAERKAVRN